MGIFVGILGAFTGCCFNAVFLEYLVKTDPGSGTLITFSQYVFIALEGFVHFSNFGQRKRSIPIKNYFMLVAIFFICNVCNNYAFNFNISMPLHMIFRSGSLITNMLMGILILKKKYSLMKITSVGLVTLGVLICTLITGNEMNKSASESAVPAEDNLFWWIVGLCILLFALFASSLLGIYQEVLYGKYGKHPYEALYYTHLLPLPFFLMFYENISNHLSIIFKSPEFEISMISTSVPIAILHLFGNVLTQYMCIKSVYYLTAQASSLTVTLILTIRKFLSLLFSIVYFHNEFTYLHWLGTLCVFIGTLMFTEVIKFPTKEEKRKIS